MDELDETARALLDLERQGLPDDGTKHAVIRERFGFGATTYYQRLNALLDTPAALAYDPVLVNRLRRIRARRQRSRRTRSTPS